MVIRNNTTSLGGWRDRLRQFLGGTMFGGMRDLYSTFGYTRNPSFDNYLFKYIKQDVAKRIINAPVDALWCEPPIIESDEIFMKEWQKVTAAHNVWAVLAKLDKLCGIGRFAVLVIGIDDGQSLEKPVRVTGNSSRNIIYLQPYMESSVKILNYETDTSSPRFGKPVMYQIQPQSPDILGQVTGINSGVNATTVAGQRNAFQVHYTRLLHIADSTLENDIFGIPRLSAVYNRLDDLEKVVGGAAETFWLTGNRGLHADVDKEMELDPDDAAALEEEIDGYVNDFRRVVKTRGVTIKNLGSDVADPSKVFNVLISLLSAATGIPRRVLMGAEAGELASSQDRANWSDRIAERAAEFGSPVVLVPFITQLVGLSILPNPSTLKITWPEAFKMTPMERASTSAQLGRTAANLQKMISDPIGAVQIQEETMVAEVDAQGNATGAQKKVIRKWIEGGAPLLQLEEARGIVGMGKTMPVFDGTGSEDVALKQ